MQFIRDVRVPDGYSKFNLLARLCASFDHRSCWYNEENGDMVAVQCGDGRVIAPDGITGRAHIVILHDWEDSYAPVLERAVKVISLGEHEGIPEKHVVLESFPLPDMIEQPVSPDNDILVAGQCVSADDMKFVKETVGAMSKELSVTVALNERGSSEIDKEISGFVYSDEMAEFDKVNRRKSPNYPMIVELYRTAGIIVHCGSGRRGFLHALAVKCASKGAGLYTRTNDNSFEPPTVVQFLEAVGEQPR